MFTFENSAVLCSISGDGDVVHLDVDATVPAAVAFAVAQLLCRAGFEGTAHEHRG